MAIPHPADYWVEATRAVKDNTRVIGYAVWQIQPNTGRTCVQTFMSNRKGGAEEALRLANAMRDGRNKAMRERREADEITTRHNLEGGPMELRRLFPGLGGRR